MSMNRAGKSTGWDSRIGRERAPERKLNTALLELAAWLALFVIVAIGACGLWLGCGGGL